MPSFHAPRFGNGDQVPPDKDLRNLRHGAEKLREQADRQDERSPARKTAGIAGSSPRVDPKFHMRLPANLHEGYLEVLK